MPFRTSSSAKLCQKLTSQKDEVTPGHMLGEEVPICKKQRQQLKEEGQVCPQDMPVPSPGLTLQHEGLHEDPDPIDRHHQVYNRQAHKRQRKHRQVQKSTGCGYSPWLILSSSLRVRLLHTPIWQVMSFCLVLVAYKLNQPVVSLRKQLWVSKTPSMPP